MIVYLRLYYIPAFCIYRFFNLPRILFSPIPVKQNHPREMHHNRCTLRVRPIAKNNGRGIRYRYNLSYGRHAFHFRSETAMDDYIGKFVDDYERVHSARQWQSEMHEQFIPKHWDKRGTVQKTHSVEKRANAWATITHGRRERWKLYAAKARQIN